MHPSDLSREQLLAECDVRHVKRGGPGGQHRNTTQSGVVVQHRSSGILAEANERRDQAQNLAVALFRLRCDLAVALRTERMELSSRWQARCRGGRMIVAKDHDDYPALLAEALDRLAAENFQVPAAANRCGCSATQLLKLVALFPPALAWLNGCRRDRGLPALRPAR